MSASFARLPTLVFASLILTPACGPGEEADEAEDGEDDDFSDGKADSEEVSEGSCEAFGVLRFVNGASLEALRGVGLTSRAASNIVSHRAGPDQVEWTPDDDFFTTLAELDGVPWVGPVSLQRVLAGALDHGYAECPALPISRRSLGACPEGEGPVRVAFFDADSTLRVSRSGSVTANTIDDVYVLPGAAEAIARLGREGYLVAVVSNQLGVSRRIITAEVAEGALLFTARQLSLLGARIDYVDFAEFDDEDRKPSTGMATRLETLLLEQCQQEVDLEGSFMVGDSGYREGVDGPHPDGRPADDFSNSDRLFAEALGVPFHEPTDYFGWREFEVYNVADGDELRSFLDAIDVEVERLRASGEDAEQLQRLSSEVHANRLVNDLF